MERLKKYISSKPALKRIAKAGLKVFRGASAWVFGPMAKAVIAMIACATRFTDGKPWIPIFYFFLPSIHTEGVQRLHILHKVQVETGRRVIVISPWWFWPASTAKDSFFVSFIHGLTPGIRYIWIPEWIYRFTDYLVRRLLSVAGRDDARLKPRDIHSTIRYHDFSTIDHSDILNYGRRVDLHIPKSHQHVMEKKLQDLGISPVDWFVCVHAREHGWHKHIIRTQYSENYSFNQEDHRNVDIRDYIPALEYIRSKGGMVVRIGDPSMKTVTGIDGFIDYPKSKYWSLPMDLFIISGCRLFLGCCSGANLFHTTFGKPGLLVNYPPPIHTVKFPYSSTLFLLKHMVEIKTGRLLTLREMFEGLRSVMNDPFRFESIGLRWESNLPEDILEATKEMLYLIENNAFDQERTREQELFHQLRIKATDYLCSNLQGSGKYRFSNGRSAQSRISATFAACYFADEEASIGEPLAASLVRDA